MQFYDPSLRVDLFHEQENPPKLSSGKPGYERGRDGKVLVRDPKTVKGIVVHQTACIFSVADYQAKAAHGDKVLAKHRRALDVPAHAIAMRTGKFVTHSPLLWFAQHGHGLNSFSLGLEIEAKAPGLRLKPKETTWGGPPVPITPETIVAARNAIGYLYEEGRALGMPLEFVWAHRQSTAKTSDPGQQLWEEIVEEFAVKVLGLKPQYDLTLIDRKGNKGKPIPVEWAKGGVGHY